MKRAFFGRRIIHPISYETHSIYTRSMIPTSESTIATSFEASGSPTRRTITVLILLVVFVSVSYHIDSMSTSFILLISMYDDKSLQETLAHSESTGACSSLPDDKPKVFNPFTDLTFSHVDIDKTAGSQPPPYSSVRCVGAGRLDWTLQSDSASYGGRRPNFVSRTCRYKNLYYRPSDQQFFYHPSETERQLRLRALEAGNESAAELLSRTEVSLGHTRERFKPEHLPEFHVTPWKPKLLPENASWWSNSSVATVDPELNTAFLLYQPFHSMNFGHVLLDDLLSLFSMMDLFHMQNDLSLQPVPLFVELPDVRRGKNHGGPDKQYRCSPYNHQKYKSCVKFYRKLFPALFGIGTDCSGDILRTGNWLLGDSQVGQWPEHPKEKCESSSVQQSPEANIASAEYILLPQVLVGTGRLNFFGCDDDCTLGRGPQFWRFRNYLMRNLFSPSEACQGNARKPAGYITFSLPVNSSRPDQVYQFDAEIKRARELYGNSTVKVVDMASISIQEQAALVQDSAIFLTNHGGSGLVSLFLPMNSAAMIFWHGKQRMDHNFYESAGYFRTTWVGVEERPFVNRTMALIADEMERFNAEWTDQVQSQERVR